MPQSNVIQPGTLPTVILLVDDQPIIAAAVQRMIASRKDWTLHYCQDPARAVEQALQIRPSVILQDLVMPDVDGLDLVTAYRRQPALQETPLVVLSSKEEPQTKARAFELGANDYLVKLPDPVEMLARLHHHAEGYKAALQRNAAYAALAASERHLQEEVRRAAEYVKSLLPPPLVEGAATSTWRFVPSESLGGDAFGHHWLDDTQLAIYLLDVCGHGVGPALLGVSAMNVIHSSAVPGRDMRDTGAVVEGLNDLFPMDRHNEMFFTLWYGILDVKRGRLRWTGAGHPPALLVHPDGSLQRLESQGLMIGAVTGLPYESSEVEIRPGMRLLLYSDGIFELQRPDGQMATLDDFIRHAGPAAVGADPLDAMLAHARAVQGAAGFKDDVSLLQVLYQP
ncbi:MAG: response regulator [Planctomycetes bacterium]|nr:response regulator [Planctomycetota bacterium]